MVAAQSRNFPSRELQRLLVLHRRWVETDGKRGAQFAVDDEHVRWDFSGLHLDRVCLRKAKLEATEFVGCSLVGADFTHADLHGALFRDSDLRNARFDEADLDYSAFDNVQTDGATFQNASMEMANIPARMRRVTAADFEL
jgi:uncharacterized protein YjbI with pentapeptide repeats